MKEIEAEILGMHAGDGHLRKIRNEFEMSGHIDEKPYYDHHVIPLFRQYTTKSIRGRYMLSKGTYGFSVSSLLLKDLLVLNGFTGGKKSLNMRVPKDIINASTSCKQHFLRGYFDTDGCLSFCKKINNTDEFKRTKNFYPRLIFCTVSIGFWLDLQYMLQECSLTFSAYSTVAKKASQSDKYIIQISGKKQVTWWFEHVSPKNNVKVSKYTEWLANGHYMRETKL